MPGTIAHRARRPVFGIAGQVLNAATNVATAYLGSRVLAPDDFGRFALALAVVTIVLAAGRGLLGSSVLVHLPTLEAGPRAALVRSATGFTLVVGLGATAVLLAAGDGTRWFAPWITLALLQDVARYVHLSAGRQGSALALDVAWAVAQAVALGAWFVVAGGLGVGALATSWGIGASAGVVVAVLLGGLRPSRPGAWLRTTRDIAGWFSGVAVIAQVELYLVLLLIGTYLGPADAGGLRAVQLLAYQPALVLLGSLVVLVVPTMVRARASPAGLGRAWRRVLVVVSPVVVSLVLVAVWRGPLMELLFPRYVAFAALVVPVALQGVLAALGTPSVVLLTGLRRGSTVFAIQVGRVATIVAGAATGVVVAGAEGLAWGLAGATAVVVGVTALAARAAWRQVGASTSAERPQTLGVEGG